MEELDLDGNGLIDEQVPLFMGAAPLFMGAVPLFKRAVPLFMGALPLFMGEGASDGAYGAAHCLVLTMLSAYYRHATTCLVGRKAMSGTDEGYVWY
eukprot:1536973-Rhodomonas_salina.1